MGGKKMKGSREWVRVRGWGVAVGAGGYAGRGGGCCSVVCVLCLCVFVWICVDG